jgi:predicted patatin/cPLA2 family phospholipase
MRGAWAAGALGALRQIRKEPFDLVVAVSSGACSAAYFVADVMEQGISLWTTRACSGQVFNKSNLLRFRPLINLDYFVDYCLGPLPVGAFDHSLTNFEIVLTDCLTGQPTYFRPDSTTVLDALKATTSLPIATRGYSLVNGVPYADGGLVDPIPVRRAIELGATDITVVLTLDGAHRIPAIPRWMCRLAYRSFPEAAVAWRRSHYAVEDSLDLIFHPPAGIRLHVVRPQKPLSVQRFTEEADAVRAAVGIGYVEAMNQLQSSAAASRTSI